MKQAKKPFFPTIIGNILEWYDFALYGFFAPIIARLFFPTDNPTISLIITFSVFAIGFIVRPLGGIIFGYLGDRYGRKSALAYAILLMAIPTTLIGLIPDYHSWGIYAVLLLILMRLLQGLAVGGEFTGSMVYIIEHAPQNRRGFFGSWTTVGSISGMLLGSAVSSLVLFFSAGTAAEDWAWRIPFLSGIVLGVIGLYLRLGMPETPFFEKQQRVLQQQINPLSSALRYFPKRILHSIIIAAFPGVYFYILFIYMPTYLTTYFGIANQTALIINSTAMVFMAISIPVFASISDRIGRKPLLLSSALLLLLLTMPLFILLQQSSILAIFISQVLFGTFYAMSFSLLPAVLVEMVPTHIRYTSISLSYNLGMGILGGTAPLVATLLISYTNSTLSPAFYLIIVALVALISLWKLPESKDVDLANIH